MKLALLNIHILSLAIAIGAMLVAEHFIAKRVIFRKLNSKPFTPDIYDVILYSSRVISVALVFLWISGIGFIFLGYQSDPLYIENQKIWAKVTIVLILSINAIYIHVALLPNLKEVSLGGALIHIGAESALLRLSFCASTVGWLMATFYGTAKFLNTGYSYWILAIPYLSIVLQLWLLSYVFCRDKANVQWREPASEKEVILEMSNHYDKQLSIPFRIKQL